MKMPDGIIAGAAQGTSGVGGVVSRRRLKRRLLIRRSRAICDSRRFLGEIVVVVGEGVGGVGLPSMLVMLELLTAVVLVEGIVVVLVGLEVGLVVGGGGRGKSLRLVNLFLRMARRRCRRCSRNLRGDVVGVVVGGEWGGFGGCRVWGGLAPGVMVVVGVVLAVVLARVLVVVVARGVVIVVVVGCVEAVGN